MRLDDHITVGPNQLVQYFEGHEEEVSFVGRLGAPVGKRCPLLSAWCAGLFLLQNGFTRSTKPIMVKPAQLAPNVLNIFFLIFVEYAH